MPNLVVNIGPMPRQMTLSQLVVACSLTDELRFSSHIGEDVSLAFMVSENGPLSIFATANLDRFTSTNGDTRAVFTNLVILREELEHPNLSVGSVFSFRSNTSDLFAPRSITPHTGGDEAFSTFVSFDDATPLEIYGQIGQQVRNIARGICALSGVTVSHSDGSATPIRPVDTGGEVHARNFIFLHDEPAQSFNRFAWTVGPDFEIIVDAWATGTNVLSTVNATGKLLVGDDQRNWPDETALAWHRQKFLERLR